MRVLQIIIATAFVGGCVSPVGQVPRGPVPASAEVADAPALPRAQETTQERVSVCVVHERQIVMVEGVIDPPTGDSLIAGRPWREVHSEQRAPYAAANPWYLSGRGLLPPGRQYPMDKYGLPRVLSPSDLRYWGEYEGVPAFVEVGTDTASMPEVAYVPVRPGCEFQPYMQVSNYGAVRG
jgi:hypothetical protein